jgi:hypothetical protein
LQVALDDAEKDFLLFSREIPLDLPLTSTSLYFFEIEDIAMLSPAEEMELADRARRGPRGETLILSFVSMLRKEFLYVPQL